MNGSLLDSLEAGNAPVRFFLITRESRGNTVRDSANLTQGRPLELPRTAQTDR